MAEYELNPFTKQMERKDADVTVSTSITSDREIGLNDGYIPADASSGELTLTLIQSNQAAKGKQFWVSKRDSSNNDVVVKAATGELINGATELRISYQYSTAHLAADGNKGWAII